MKCPLIVSAAVILVSLSGTANARDQLESLVTRWYTQYLHRRPSPEEVYSWTSQIREGVSLLDAEADILSSDEYCRLNGYDPWRYIPALYRDVLGRYPDRSEVESHMPGWRAWGARRQGFAKDFLQAAQAELNAGRRSRPPLLPEEYDDWRLTPRPRVPYYRR